MTPLYQWAARNRISHEALRDLQVTMGLHTPDVPVPLAAAGRSEAWVQSMVRLEASEKGVKLFRNNVGALKDTTGRVVRFGLANDSKELNEVIKSGDLIGWRSHMVVPADVGRLVAIFVSREIKEPGWQYTGTPHEVAQAAWMGMINSAGGDACFANGVGTL